MESPVTDITVLNKQLARLEQQVKELRQEKNQLIGLVSHDLKSPLNRIFALMQLISRSGSNLTSEQQEYLAKIHQIIADLMMMVRNLLDDRRIGNGEIEFRPERFNLSALLMTLLKNFRPLAELKHLQLHVSIPPGVQVMQDKHYLVRVIENGIANAIKFSPEYKKLHVELISNEKDVLLLVRDEGPGISKDEQAKLFHKFQPLRARPTGSESATGIGLAVAKALADKIGIGMRVVSEEGTGTVFTLNLPAAKEELRTKEPSI
jgi:signal transduction histidine kinase